MSSQQQKIRDFLRHERLSSLAVWCVCLGLLALFIAFETLGSSDTENPKTALSVYSAFAASGLLQPLALPLVILGVTLIAVGVLINAFLFFGKRRKRS